MRGTLALLLPLPLVLPLLVATASAADPAAPVGIVLDSPMDADPPVPTVVTFNRLAPGLKPLWFSALAGPEAELKMRAAEAIAEVRLSGRDDMADAAPHLLKALEEPRHTLPVRLAAARALIVVDARQAAPALFAQAERGELDMRQLVEPALAAWGHEPALAVWLARLENPAASPPTLLLAVRCLGVVREPAALRGLRSLVENPDLSGGLRLEAARALAAVDPAEAQRVAGKLLSEGGPSRTVERLAAASLLQTAGDGEAKDLLERLSLDEEPAVGAIAYGRLLEVDPAAAVALAGRLVGSRDAKVRQLGARALEAVPSADGVATLGPLLDDPHPDVRAYVRDALFRLAGKPELDAPVREAGARVLAAESWRGLEQGALLLGALDHEAAADRLVVLLEHERPEVTVAAAWSLRRLAVTETLAPALEVARRRAERLRREVDGPGHDDQSAQLFQMFAAMGHREAEPLLREHVPKEFLLGDRARSAAVWALGHFYADSPEPTLVAALEGRLNDTASQFPETGAVRRAAAASLGRMRARDALPSLKAHYAPNGSYDSVTGACNWAVNRITGEVFPDPPPVPVGATGFFLEPL